MYVKITLLEYWKSDHGAGGSQDATAFDPATGRFAVADGVSLTAFAGPWARHIAETFVRAVPLLSADPFEVEWWVRTTQEAYTASGNAPDLATVPPGILRERAADGAAATLATLRCLRREDAAATCLMLAIGDSCVLHRRDGRASLFPSLQPEDFDTPPMSVHSRRYDTRFVEARQEEARFRPGDVAILATDAVARWALQRTDGHGYDALPPLAEAIAQLERITPGMWPSFVEAQRTRRQMADDDATALIIQFVSNTISSGGDATALGTSETLSPEWRASRQADLELACKEADSVAIARLAGDVRAAGLNLHGQEIATIRRAAVETTDGIAAVLTALNREPVNPADVRAAWTRYADVLDREPAAARLRQALLREGLLADASPFAGASAGDADA